MALQAFKPKFVDYLLSGFAGAAKGAEIGITRRQKTERQKAAAEATAAFKEREISLQEREEIALAKFRKMQQALGIGRLVETRAGRKAGEKATKEAEKFRLQLQRLIGKQEIEQIKTKADVTPGGSFLDRMLKRTAEVVGIQNIQSQIKSRALRDQIADVGSQFEKEKFTYTKLKDETARWDMYAKENLSIQNQRAIKQYDTLVDLYMATEVVPLKKMYAEKQMEDLRYYLFRSLFDPDASAEDKQEAGKGYEWLSKRFGQWTQRELGEKVDLPPIDWEDAWYKRAKPVPGAVPPVGETKARQPLPILGGPTGIEPLQGGGGRITAGLPAPMQELMGPPAPPAKSQSEIQSMISFFRDEENIKELSPDDVAKLQRLGYSDEDIVAIQEGL